MSRKTPLGEDAFARRYDPEYEHDLTSRIPQYYGQTVGKGTVRFLVTTAQNATPVFKPFWKSLGHCRDFYRAHLSVIPHRYKNPTSQWAGSQENAEYWVKEVREYLNNQRWAINKNL